MGRYLVVHPDFELVWPDVPDHLADLWRAENDDVEYVRLAEADRRPLGEILDDPGTVEQLVALGVPVTGACLDALSNLTEATVMNGGYAPDEAVHEALAERGVETHFHDSEGFWSESVAELGVALTLGAMRRVPQKHHAMAQSHDPWDWSRWEEGADRGYGGFQGTGDAPFWTHGTLRDTAVRGVGVGNIGSRYLDYLGAMGADVTAYDPYADGAAFHRIGADQVHTLSDLVPGAEIFAPLVPLTDETEGMVDRDLVYDLPAGCLLVLVTRAGVVDTEAVRERVLADELALAADVYDEEPLPLDDPLLSRENVVHTPHLAGRTPDANAAWARMLLARFGSSGVTGPD